MILFQEQMKKTICRSERQRVYPSKSPLKGRLCRSTALKIAVAKVPFRGFRGKWEKFLFIEKYFQIMKLHFSFSVLLFSFFPFLLLFCVACSSDYSPKPAGYFRIDLVTAEYSTDNRFSEFAFDRSTQVKVEEVPNPKNEVWFNLVYPALNARIYCEYLPLTSTNFEQVTEDSRKLAYLHVIKADAIQEKQFKNPAQNVYGLVYTIKGNVASPVQFLLTDSVKSFFRGALYVENKPNQDSIAPVLAYINKDIQVLIESFQWKNKKR
jgi:gliding motility-associated lipoprotein GldD